MLRLQPDIINAVADVVREGARRGLPMAVASGGSRHHVMKGLISSGLAQYFPEDCVVTAEDVKHGKPAPDAFLLAAARIGVEPQFCVGYEDAVRGSVCIWDRRCLACLACNRHAECAELDVSTVPAMLLYPRMLI